MSETCESTTQRDEEFTVGEKTPRVVEDGNEVFVAAREDGSTDDQVILMRRHNARELYQELSEVFHEESVPTHFIVFEVDGVKCYTDPVTFKPDLEEKKEALEAKESTDNVRVVSYE